jgi:hypothetical protein
VRRALVDRRSLRTRRDPHEIREVGDRERTACRPDLVRELYAEGGFDRGQEVDERERVEAEAELPERLVERDRAPAPEQELVPDDPGDLLLGR